MSSVSQSVPPPQLDLGSHRGRMSALDGLRAISIALVLLGHISGTVGFPKISLSLVLGDYANLGVVVFFVISGYLITRLLVEEHQQFGSISLRLFYARRAIRLAPAFLWYIAFIAIVERFRWIRLNSGDIFSALTYTINFRTGSSWYVGHLWSLSVEEQFYLLWPAIVVIVGIRKSLWVAVGMILVSPIARLWALQHHEPGSMFPCVADSIAFGCLLAIVGENLLSRKWYRAFVERPLFVPTAVILIFACNWLRSYFVGILVGVSIINLLVSVLVHRCTLTGSRVTAFLSLRPMVAVGAFSYSLYLWQQFFLNRNSSWAICRFPANILLAVCAAFLSYYFVELPLNDFRRRLRRAKSDWPPESIPPNRQLPHYPHVHRK
jgi:peptidoglycan/LPS O-acetylase OafA/YrhL